MKYNKIRDNYTELKLLYKEIKALSREENARFEDVSEELAELDRIGKVHYEPYTEFYQRSQNSSSDYRPTPSGVTAENPNYNYRGIYEYSRNRNR